MTTDATHRTARRRIVLAVAAVVTICAGLVVHRLGTGAVADIAGDALYAVMVYLLIACALPRLASWRIAAATVGACTAIELLQLTGLPRSWADAFPPIGLVFGTGFDGRDLIAYAVAATTTMVVDAISRTRARTRPGTTEGALPKESAL